MNKKDEANKKNSERIKKSPSGDCEFCEFKMEKVHFR